MNLIFFRSQVLKIKSILWRLCYGLCHGFFLGLLWLPSASCKTSPWTPPTADKPTIRCGVTGASLDLNLLEPKKKSTIPVNYRPNSEGRLACGAQYNFLGLTIGLTSEPTPEKILLKGRTRGQDFQFRFFREEHSFEIFYQKYHGYFIDNSKQVDPTWSSSGPYLQRSDLQTEHFGVQYFKTLSPEKFSLAASFDQSGWQNESAGTWFYYGAIDQHRLTAEDSFVPPTLLGSYAALADFKGGRFSTLKIGAGGAYTYAYKSFFLAGKIIVAGGQQQQDYKLNGSNSRYLLPTSGANLKISLGYNGPQYFTSLNVFSDSTNIYIKNREIAMITMDVSLFFGTHF